MPSYTFVRAAGAARMALPPGGLHCQLVGRLALVDAEEAYAELDPCTPAQHPCAPGAMPQLALALLTNLIPAEDVPAVGTHVHLFGLLQDKPTAASAARAAGAQQGSTSEWVAEGAAVGAAEGAAAGAAVGVSNSGVLRVLRIDILRVASGVDLELLESVLQARQAAAPGSLTA